jgi:hypothetical protein
VRGLNRPRQRHRDLPPSPVPAARRGLRNRGRRASRAVAGALAELGSFQWFVQLDASLASRGRSSDWPLVSSGASDSVLVPHDRPPPNCRQWTIATSSPTKCPLSSIRIRTGHSSAAPHLICENELAAAYIVIMRANKHGTTSGGRDPTNRAPRPRGSIDTLPSGSLRVRVYAGIDPITHHHRPTWTPPLNPSHGTRHGHDRPAGRPWFAGS